MKILMVIPALGNVYGGPTKIVLELAESVAKLGVNVDIVATNANGSKTLNVPLNKWTMVKNYRVKYFSYLNFLDYKFTLSMTKWLFHNVSDYDMVHTNAIFSYPVLAAHLACQFRIVPYIATPHGMMEPWALAYKAWKKKFYFTLFENPSLQKANAIQLTASTEARHINTLDLKTPLIFIPNGINITDFESLPSAELFYEQFPNTRNKTLIIFLGRIDPKKGLDLLATAFAEAHEKFPEAHLIVAGPDNTGFLPTAESYFSEAGCKDAVTFTGMLTGAIKYAALAAANIYVAPSYSEGFSMSVLEGMAAGLPCVITTGCNFPEAAEAEAASVVDINTDKIANALIRLLQDPIQAKNMGDRARQFILENYTWDRVASKLILVYQDIIRKTHKNPVSLDDEVSG
ncbi:MAG: glycosyltransferase [Nostoc sp.]|uniref:glycosyltransferase n=1 Tax=Nostoc sp. TaxID=1180 RepID=UPI002FF05DAC